jgi:hypothetical protein
LTPVERKTDDTRRWKIPWYFLSTTRLKEINRLQVPENDAGEEAVPRLCLAPTVWQSLLAIGHIALSEGPGVTERQ